MNVQQMREKLRKHYDSPGSPFLKKLDKMSDKQIIAVYFRHVEKGVFK